jgi:2-keto-3-deoxy-L-fuconate dehydrogenase
VQLDFAGARAHSVRGRLSAEELSGREKEMYEKLAASAAMGRMGQPEEVASLALFLCSDAASFLTGVDYPLDGGFFNLHG